MTKGRILIVLGLATAAGLAFFNTPAQAAHSRHIDLLASHLRHQADDLEDVLRDHYRGTPQFGHLMADVNRVEIYARRLEVLARYGRDAYQLKSTFTRIQQAFVHLKEIVDGPYYSQCQCNRGHGHHCAVHRNPLSPWLSRMQYTIHQLGEQLRAVNAPLYRGSRPDHRVGYRDGVHHAPQYGATPSRHDGAITLRDHGVTTPRDHGVTTPRDHGATTSRHYGATTSRHYGATTSRRYGVSTHRDFVQGPQFYLGLGRGLSIRLGR